MEGFHRSVMSLSMSEWLEFGRGRPQEKKKTTVSRSSYRTLSYLATISARSWSSFTAASCSVSDAGEQTEEGEEREERHEWVSTQTSALCVRSDDFRLLHKVKGRFKRVAPERTVYSGKDNSSSMFWFNYRGDTKHINAPGWRDRRQSRPGVSNSFL